jgi:hypothetical protein
VDSCGRTIFVADAHRGEGQRFIVRADEKLTAFVELESVIHRAIAISAHELSVTILLSTMKAFFSIILALAVSMGSVQAGPVHRAANVAKGTAYTAKNVAHSVVKGTRRAVHTVVYRLTR